LVAYGADSDRLWQRAAVALGLLAEAAALPGVRVLVVRGAGTRSFSVGADIAEFAAVRSTPEQAAAYDEAVLAAEKALASFPAPTIAAVHGYCYGGSPASLTGFPPMTSRTRRSAPPPWPAETSPRACAPSWNAARLASAELAGWVC
jgi:hypothetical protein